jgi:hypothetical protein
MAIPPFFERFRPVLAYLLLSSLTIKPTGLTGHGRGGYQVVSALFYIDSRFFSRRVIFRSGFAQ